MNNSTKKTSVKKNLSNLEVLEEKFLQHVEPRNSDTPDQFLQDFRNLDSNNKRVDWIFQKMVEFSLFDPEFGYKTESKCDKNAMVYKTKADGEQAAGDFPAAFQNYTKCLLHAKSQQLLAVTYAARSATLFKLHLHQECIADIKKAFSNNCPDELTHDLNNRRKESLKILRKTKKTTPPFYEDPPEIPCSQKNQLIEGASNAILVRRGDNRVSVVATRDIEIGETIAVETPFTAIIGGGELFHCHECFNLCYSTIPCDKCSYVIYCNEDCKMKAYSKYHQYECPILYSLHSFLGEYRHFLLALKITFLNKTQNAKHVLDFMANSPERWQGGYEVAIGIVTGYMFNLVKRHTKWFGDDDQSLELLFKDVLYEFLTCCLFAMYDVIELYPNVIHSLRETEGQSFARCILPFCAAFRHSCCANVSSHCHGVKKVYIAVRTIKQNQECFLSYGPYYSITSKEVRQRDLRNNFGFTCKCRACIENWPTTFEYGLDLQTRNDLRILCDKKCSVETVKRTISKKIQWMKKHEHMEPDSKVCFQNKMLICCLDRLGNQRRAF